MKLGNLLGCIFTCPSMCSSNCVWFCLFSPCSMAIDKLNSGSNVRFLLLALCFFCTPFLCILGCINWILGIPKSLDAVKSFLDTGDAITGYKNIIHPEDKTEIIASGEGFLNKIFTC